MSFIEQRSAFRINDTLILNYIKLAGKEPQLAIDAIESGNPNEDDEHIFPEVSPERTPTTINLSATGIACTTNKLLAKDDTLAISLYLSVAEPAIRIVGKVIEMKEDPEGGTGYLRVHFTHITQHDKLRIMNYTSKFIEEQRLIINKQHNTPRQAP